MSRSALSLIGDRRGAAMVEFAFVAPILILLYVGMAELCQGLMAERKAAHVASSIADLVAQSDEVTPASISGVLDIADVILEPFPGGTDLEVRVTSVLVDEDDTPRVVWSENRHWEDLQEDSIVDLPEISDGAGGTRAFLAEGESVIMTEVEYAFETPFSDIFTQVQKLALGSAAIHEGGYTFDAIYYLRPRRSDQVICEDCND